MALSFSDAMQSEISYTALRQPVPCALLNSLNGKHSFIPPQQRKTTLFECSLKMYACYWISGGYERPFSPLRTGNKTNFDVSLSRSSLQSRKARRQALRLPSPNSASVRIVGIRQWVSCRRLAEPLSWRLQRPRMRTFGHGGGIILTVAVIVVIDKACAKHRYYFME